LRIGIVGGGAAGLICAWLLEADHEVTLFESDPIFGGHAKSHTVTIDGARFDVNPGFHFVSPKLQPTLIRLLDELHVKTSPYGMTCTFYDTNSTRALALPPLGNLKRFSTALAPQNLATLSRLGRVLSRVEGLSLDSDSDRTLDSFLAPMNLPESFTRDFLYPFLGSNWGVPDAEVPAFSTPNALLYAHRNQGLNPRWLEVDGGMGVYVQALRDACTRTQFCTGRAIARVCPAEHGVDVIDDAGSTTRFDRVILATNAETAARVLDGSETDEIKNALAGYEYFDTKIAIHGDASVMPHDRALWSVVNLRRDGAACAIHHWAGWRTRTPVFRSWITHVTRPVASVHAEFAYRHPKPTPAYFAAQRGLAGLQGRGGLWVAGMHTTGYDNHESAVQSAVRIARTLSPDSARLRALDAAPA